MKETIYLLQTYEICFKLIYLKLLQEYLNNEIIGFTDCENNEETAYYTVTDIQGSITEVYEGKYYSPVGTDPNTLGINTDGRVKSLYQLNKDTYVLQSTAKNTLGNSNLPIWAQGDGGGIQFFTIEQQNFIKVK